MKTTICLIRHGQTDWNKNLVIQGRRNIPLNETGIMQAEETGKLLQQTDPNWDLIISSPLDRAYNTAKIIAKYINYDKDIIIDDRFIEREFGMAEGMPIEPVIYTKIDHNDVVGIEHSDDLENRIYNAVISIAEEHQGKKIIITSHSHSIKGLVLKLNQLENYPHDYTYQTCRIYNTALNYFEIEDGVITSYKLNIK